MQLSTTSILATPAQQRKRNGSPPSRPAPALAGVTLTRIEGDEQRAAVVASRWALTKSFDNIGVVDAWLSRVAGVPR